MTNIPPVHQVAETISPDSITGDEIERLMKAVLLELDPLCRDMRIDRYRIWKQKFFNRNNAVWNTVHNTVMFYYDTRCEKSRGERTDALFKEAFNAVVRALQTDTPIRQIRTITIDVRKIYMGQT